jgi:dihydrodipicolinate synthase/N-acetylneuraminate lyase
MAMPVQGVFAAALTPRTVEGKIDTDALERTLDFLISTGIKGFALNGATGEFTVTTPAEFQTILKVTADVTRNRATFVAGIGAASERQTVDLGRLALRAGASALLLPMPCFFPYSQDDLATFARSVASQLDGDILLYNLPQFTSGLEPRTSVNLIAEVENLVGIKDSSGSLETLGLLTHERIPACRVIGNDSALAPALAEDLCDGVVSGVACALPELMQALYAATGSQARHLTGLLQGFIAYLDTLPVPWGLKVIAELRGLAAAHYVLPLSPTRNAAILAFQQWFETNRQSLFSEVQVPA